MWDLPGTGERTCVPCIGRRILKHCATREVPVIIQSEEEIIQSETKTLKKINSLRHLANNIKGFNIRVLESEEKKVEMGQKKNICQNDG